MKMVGGKNKRNNWEKFVEENLEIVWVRPFERYIQWYRFNFSRVSWVHQYIDLLINLRLGY